MGKLILEEQTKQSVAIENAFYGRDVTFSMPSDAGLLSVEVCRHRARFGIQLDIHIGATACSIFLESLPPLEQLSTKFQGIDLFSLPSELQITVLREACSTLLEYFSQRLGSTVTIDAITILSTYDVNEGVNFMINRGDNYITSGTLVAPKEIFAMLSRKILSVPKLRRWDNVDMEYRCRLGKTVLSPNEYSEIAEGDIIFLDEHDLAGDSKVDIVGLGSLKIRGQVTSDGVVVRQIN